jgi:hypothetical protein
LDHLVRAQQQRLRDGDPQRFRRSQVGSLVKDRAILRSRRRFTHAGEWPVVDRELPDRSRSQNDLKPTCQQLESGHSNRSRRRNQSTEEQGRPSGPFAGAHHRIKPVVIVAEKTKTGNLLDNAAAEKRATAGGSTEKLAGIVQKLYSSKKIDIVGGVYDLATGKIALV